MYLKEKKKSHFKAYLCNEWSFGVRYVSLLSGINFKKGIVFSSSIKNTMHFGNVILYIFTFRVCFYYFIAKYEL